MTLFSVQNLQASLGGRQVLDIGKLDIPEGRVVALTGPNGSGKTTLLQILAGLLQPQGGRVRYLQFDLFPVTTAAQEKVRADLGIVLQSAYLFKTTVLQNVCYGLTRRGMTRGEAVPRAEEALTQVGLKGFGKRSHSALSGGEAQRVALARALVLEPAVLLLDEPFANVDSVSRSVIERVLLQENRTNNTSVLFTTHDMDQAYRMADEVVTLFEGRIHEGSMENLFHGRVRRTGEGAVFETGRIALAVPEGHDRAVTAAVPPESILVSLTPISSSARNTHHGRITAIRERSGTVDVTVDAGDVLIARLTKQSYVELGLMLGGEVYLIFKAEAVKLF